MPVRVQKLVSKLLIPAKVWKHHSLIIPTYYKRTCDSLEYMLQITYSKNIVAFSFYFSSIRAFFYKTTSVHAKGRNFKLVLYIASWKGCIIVLSYCGISFVYLCDIILFQISSHWLWYALVVTHFTSVVCY